MLQFRQILIIIVVVSILLLLSFYTGMKLAPKQEYVEKIDTIIIYDTIVIEKEPIIIDRTRTKVKFLKDTIIQTRPFQAILDTIVKKDTIKAMYEFPEHLFSLELRKGKDTVPVKTIKMVQTKIVEKKKEWYELPLYVGSGFIIGFLAGRVK